MQLPTSPRWWPIPPRLMLGCLVGRRAPLRPADPYNTDVMRRSRHLRSAALARAFLLMLAAMGAASDARAQGYPFSQRGSVSQNVAHTHITIRYGRPVTRGRALFGQLVPWDKVWHPGADSATTIALTHDVLVEGGPLKAGEYSLWLIPRQTAPWTLIFSRAARAFHQPYPGAEHDALRVDVAPDTGSHMESMAFYFERVVREDAVLQLHWGSRILPVRITAFYKPPEDPQTQR